MSQERLHRIKPELLEFARERRKNSTHTEAMLWRMLRGKKMNGLKFRREHIFSELGYIVDFYCPEYKLIVEIDGNIHEREDIKKRDVVRQRELEEAGFRVI